MSIIFNYVTLAISSLVGCNIALYMFSSVSPTAEFLARLLASYLSLVACALYGVLASVFLRLIGYGRISQWATARCFKYVMWYATGVTFEVDDPHDYLNRTRPAVFISNHQTELDVLLLGNIFPKYCSVTAKSSLRHTPLLGWFMTLSGTVFIDRQNSTSAREAMAGAAGEIRRHRQSVYMFPEGTRSYYKEPGLLPFKKGAFHLAVQAKVPIVPIVVSNYSDILNVRSWTFKGGKIPVKGRAHGTNMWHTISDVS
jgi:lysophosphatidate acyltransferase